MIFDIIQLFMADKISYNNKNSDILYAKTAKQRANIKVFRVRKVEKRRRE
ncbi:MAG: hypothetical protein K2G42_04325 [Clostridia bacterium]|nr:hypothetical protein [Clostridia bacterium]